MAEGVFEAVAGSAQTQVSVAEVSDTHFVTRPVNLRLSVAHRSGFDDPERDALEDFVF
jgi:hypothetical protein